jgi:hypothetical protein
MSNFVLIYRNKQGGTVHKIVTWQNYHAVAAIMHRELDNPSPKHVLAAKLENRLRYFDGR